MRKLIFISLLLSVLGCTKAENDSIKRNSPMRVNAMVESAEAFGSGNPVFLFWLDTDFSAIAQNTSVEPYLVAWPYGTIDSYKTETYNTGKKYPANNQTVKCTGYYPSTLIAGEDEEKNHWSTLTVPSDQVGLTDVMVVKTPITGSENSHFETKTPKEPLYFYHAQSKINFKAKMGSDMAKNRYLRNVKVTIPGKDQLVRTFVWENGRYTAGEILQDETYMVNLLDPNSAQLDPNEIQSRELGSIYLRPGQKQITFDLQVELSETVTFDTYEIIRTSKPMTLNFSTNGTAITLAEGDEYDINITVLYDSFVVTGKKAKWQDGGDIPLPF